MLSPEASLVALDRWQALSAERRRGFAPLCPDLVVELASTGASPSDEGPRGLTALRQKMAAYQRNGARLGWLLIPAERAVEIWEPLADTPAQPRRIEAASYLDGDPHLPGLAGDGLSEGQTAFLQLAPTLAGCARRYGHDCRRYRPRAKPARQPGWGSKLLGRDPSAGSSSSGLGKGGAGQWRQASKFCRRMAVGRWRPYRRIGSKRPSISGA